MFNKILRFLVLILLLCFLSLFAQNKDSNRTNKIKKLNVDDYSHYHNVGNMGMTVTNYGLLGNGYLDALQDQPSCQYKFRSNNERERIEHFSYAGLWIGGIGGMKGEHKRLVSTAIVDGVFEYGEAGFEFTTTADPEDVVKERSSIITSPLFDPSAISHQDFICDFTDKNTVVPGSEDIQLIDHTPLGLDVHYESYAWNYAYADAFVILNYTITNISNYPIEDIYVGMWVDASIANMNYTSAYGTGGGFSWYDNINNFDKEYKMGYQYDYDGDNGFAESYLGIRSLGASVLRDQYTVYYDQWKWTNASEPDFFMPSNDEERYEKLSTTPLASIPTTEDDQGSWMLLVSIGPLGNIEPGESVNVVFAVVCGLWATSGSDSPDRRKNLRVNSDWAQIAYNGEDVDGDGKLDPDEDTNGNGILDGSEDDYQASLDLNVNGYWDPGEEVYGDGDGHLDVYEDTYSNFQRGIQDSNGVIDRYILPSAPPSPNLLVVPEDRMVTLYWDNLPENFEDPITKEKDFEGYRIYSAPKTSNSTDDMTLLAQFDINDSLAYGYNTDFSVIRCDTIINNKQYNYRFVNDNLHNGWPGKYFYSVTSFDHGNPENNLPSLESSLFENITYAVVGKTPQQDTNEKIYVYPNPYKAGALWDGAGSRDRLIWFANLPEEATIRIFTLAGDHVNTIKHNANTYAGQDVALISGQTSSRNTVFSGGEHAWDLITKNDQAIASGLYLYSVTNEKTGKVYTGKFLVIK